MQSEKHESPLAGRIDDKLIIFTYSGDVGKEQLSYRLEDAEANETVSIDAKHIICVLAPDDKHLITDQYTVLFLQNAQPVPALRTLTSREVPRQLLKDYSANQVSHWLASKETREDQDITRYIVVSTLSGGQSAARFFEDAIKPLLLHAGLKMDKDYSVLHTESPQSVSEFASSVLNKQAVKGKVQSVMLLSGDGGIVDMVNALMPLEGGAVVRPTLSLIPMGTANALAHSIGITTDDTSGLSTLMRGSSRPLPLFKATFSPGSRLIVDEGRQEEHLPQNKDGGNPVLYGAVVCSWGLHAALVADSDTVEYRKFGTERFKMAAKENLYPSDGSEPHRYRAKVSILLKSDEMKKEWQVVDREEHAYVLATLVSNLEKSFTISPASKPLDGSFRLVHFGPLSGDKVMQLMNLAYQGGQHVREPEVGYEDIHGLKIEFKDDGEDGRWRRICVDGKIVRVESGGWVEVRKELQSPVDVLCFPEDKR